MADPLSIAAGVAGLVSLAVQVTQGIHDYYSAYRRQNDEVAHLCSNLDSLAATLVALTEALEHRQTDGELIKNIEVAMQGSREIIEELEEELNKIKPQQSQNFKGRFKSASYRLRYPFFESTLRKLSEQITDFLRDLSLVLDVLNYKDAQRISKEIDEIRVAVDQVRVLQASQENRDWLRPPDPSSNHEEKCLQRHDGTGLWLTQGPDFKNWLSGGTWLWLCGFSGCGKSVLCSTAIKETFAYKASSEQRIGVCYFYFSFTDDSKQDISAMMRSVVLQIASQTGNGDNELDKLRPAQPSGLPSLQTLLKLFKSLLANFHDVYLLIDALDEVPVHNNREHVLSTLEALHNWNESKLHVLVTSRDHMDIHEVMHGISHTILLRNEGIDKDITLYIRGQLFTSRKLRKWTKKQIYRDRIEEALTHGAKGMFRWVECQFETLATFPVSRDMLERVLQSLPSSLDQTYERMLLAINESVREEARRILLFICFAQRPLFAEEIIDFLAIKELDGKASHFDPECRLDSVDGIVDICPGILHVSEDFYNGMPTRKLQIAHFSVQEYLVSERIREATSVAFFSLKSEICHDEIAQACLTYLLSERVAYSETISKKDIHWDETSFLEFKFQCEFPLYMYACLNWVQHYRSCQVVSEYTDHLGFELLVNNYERLKLCLWTRRWPSFILSCSPRVSALHIAAFLGLHGLSRHIIEQARLSEHPTPGLLNRKELKALSMDKKYGILPCPNESTHLTVFARDSARKTIKFDVDHLNAMHSAVFEGHIQIVELLLNHGMKVDEMGLAVQCLHRRVKTTQTYPPLAVALLGQQVNMSKFLIGRGANIELAARNLRVRDWVSLGRENQLENSFLREIGLDITIPFFDRLRIRAAISYVNADVWRNFLQQGVGIAQADLGTDSCLLCEAFLAVKSRRDKDAPEILELTLAQLDHISNGLVGCSTCLRYASLAKCAESVPFLRPHLSSRFGLMRYLFLCNQVAVQACIAGQVQFLKAMIDEGVRIQYIARQLLWFTERKFKENIDGCIKFLLECTEDLTEHQRFVLLAASGDSKEVKQILQRSRSLPLDLAIAWAARYGQKSTVRQLIQHCRSYPLWAIQDAIEAQSIDVLDQFLDFGVDWTKDDGSSLCELAYRGQCVMAKKLLEHGADPNKPVKRNTTFSTLDPLPAGVELQELPSYGFRPLDVTTRSHNRTAHTPLSSATTVEMVKLLFEYGAIVAGPEPLYLRLADSRGHESRPGSLEIIKVCIEHGANVNQLRVFDVPFDHSILTWLVQGVNCCLEDFKQICDAGANIDPTPKKGVKDYDNPLIAAIDNMRPKLEIVEFLLNRGATVYDYTIHAASNIPALLRILHNHISTHGISIEKLEEKLEFDE